MIFRNYKKLNKYKEILDNFTDENRLMSFGVVKNFVDNRYKWIANYKFKVRNNFQTNKHRAFVCFYSDEEMVLNEYGNVDEMLDNAYMLDNSIKPKLGSNYYELTSKQYRWISNEYVEFDQVEYIDASNQIEYNIDDTVDSINIFHGYGDSALFVATGYKIPYGSDFVYVYDNPQSDVELKYDNIEVTFNDKASDIYSNQYYMDYINSLTTIAQGGTMATESNLTNLPGILESVCEFTDNTP